MCNPKLPLLHHPSPSQTLIHHLCWSCGLATSEISGDTEIEKTDADDEDDAEDHDNTGLLASPVTLGELVSGIAQLERLQSRDCCHFEGFTIKGQQ